MRALGALIGLGFVGYGTYRLLSKSEDLDLTRKVPSPPTTKPGPAMPTTPVPDTAYVTKPDDAELHPKGGLVEALGKRWTALPLIDTRTGLFARLTWEGTQQAFERLGLRFIAPSEWQELYKSGEGILLKPCTLVRTSADQYRMRSIEFARKHDDCVWEQLNALSYDGTRVVISAGKDWSPTRGNNYGWLQAPSGKPIQPDAGAHAAEWRIYTDYSQLAKGIAT